MKTSVDGKLGRKTFFIKLTFRAIEFFQGKNFKQLTLGLENLLVEHNSLMNLGRLKRNNFGREGRNISELGQARSSNFCFGPEIRKMPKVVPEN